MSETRRAEAFEITIPSLAFRTDDDSDIADIPGELIRRAVLGSTSPPSDPSHPAVG